MTTHVDSCVHLRAAGVSVLLDLTAGRLPAVVHWGADLGDVCLVDALSLIEAGVHPVTPNLVDEPVRVALLPEAWTGWPGRPGLRGSRGGRDWSPTFATTALRVDGEAVTGGGGQVVLVDAGCVLVEVEAVDEVARLGLLLSIELLVGGVLRSRARLTNLGAEAYALDDLVLAYPVPPVARELLDLSGRWGRERSPQRRDFSVGVHLREGRKGRTGPDAATVLHAGTPGFSFAGGQVWGVHTGWSGNHTHYAERMSTGEQVVGGGELLLPGEVILGERESYTSPWLYGSFGVGLDAVAGRFHRYLRSRPQHPASPRPVTLNVWEAVYFAHELDALVELAEKAASVGVERYVLDDGWFGSRRNDRAGLGDWWVSPDVWPHGLHPLVDRVTELGMQFGLWFEPEMVNPDSDTARAHPEWIMATGGRTPVESRHQQVLNLGIPACYAAIRDAIFAILDEYDISYLKWDHNRDLVDAGTHPDGRPGVHTQTEALYRLLDEIRAAHPGLEIESCSSGGARVDLGILQRTDRVWASDCIDPHERQLIQRWTAQLVPLEMMGSHIASATSHTTGRTHDLGFRAATAVFGHLGIEWDLRRASEEELAELSAWVRFHKDHRELIHGGDLIRLDFPDASLTATAVVSPDRSRALYSFATVDRSDVALLGRMRFPGLDPDRRYRVTPLLLGATALNLLPARWWGVEREAGELLDVAAGYRSGFAPVREPTGVELPGRLLMEVGLMHAPTNPDQAVLFRVDAVS